MAVIGHARQFLFVLTPRTASTAVASLLIDELGGEYLPGEDVVDDEGAFVLQRKHATLDQILAHGYLGSEDASKLLKFTTVRNPFDSLVSLYEKRRDKYQPLLDDPDSWVHKVPGYADDMRFCADHTFGQWIRRHYSRTAIKRMIGGTPSMYRRFTDGLDMVMRFERLDTDFNEFLERAEIDLTMSVPKVNSTDEREADYRRYYDKTSRRIVEFALKDDLDRYGYEF